MKNISHKSAEATHYNEEAKHYDIFNEQSSAIINKNIEKILKKHKVKTVLDLTCGTGSQIFYLAKKGFSVVGSDINEKMLKIARSKAKEQKLNVKFYKDDMRSAQLGNFDAVVTIFNAVGHLTKSDFAKAIRNINDNLSSNGLYIFDIFNLDYFLDGDNITKLTIDWFKRVDNIKTRVIQYSTIDEAGILASFTTAIEQRDGRKARLLNSSQTLQIYSAEPLSEMLRKKGFEILTICNVDGSHFENKKSERMLIVAKKRHI
jgi:ubiquinone/menaquinone biosynthesis C-methylase UbiE